MNAITHVPAAFLILTTAVHGLVVFDNHRYGDGAETSHLKGFSGLQTQMLKERKDFLMKYIGELVPTVSTDDFKPKDHIRPNDVVGIIPQDMFKKSVKNSTSVIKKGHRGTTVKPVDSDTGESQLVHQYENMWSNSDYTPERIRNHKYAPPAHKSYGLYEKPHGVVRVHTYRGKPKEYWVVPLDHKPEQKSYSPWGYYVKQPVGSQQHKFHSPLDLTFRYE